MFVKITREDVEDIDRNMSALASFLLDTYNNASTAALILHNIKEELNKLKEEFEME